MAGGGFRGVYQGVGSAFVGSAPSGALFFVTYEKSKSFIKSHVSNDQAVYVDPISHLIAGSLGEVAACAARVPTEVVKQRVQASQHASSLASFKHVFAQSDGGGIVGTVRELYRGGSITLLRDVPFTMIQFPLWEAMKSYRQRTENRVQITGLESAVFGSISGAVAAIMTTPLDVLKTRTMLAADRQSLSSTLQSTVRDGGLRALFAGVVPRTIWISAGGAVFLGSYQLVSNALE